MRAAKMLALFGLRGVAVLTVTAIVFVIGCATGCGGPPAAARTALTVTTTGVAAADLAAAPVYERRGETCLAEHETAAGYRECVSRVDALETGLRTTHRALLTTQASLDAWDAGADEGATFMASAPCLAEALSGLLATMTAAGVELPEAMQTAVGLLGAFGGECAP